jgi:hypothetical protein
MISIRKLFCLALIFSFSALVNAAIAVEVEGKFVSKSGDRVTIEKEKHLVEIPYSALTPENQQKVSAAKIGEIVKITNLKPKYIELKSKK